MRLSQGLYGIYFELFFSFIFNFSAFYKSSRWNRIDVKREATITVTVCFLSTKKSFGSSYIPENSTRVARQYM